MKKKPEKKYLLLNKDLPGNETFSANKILKKAKILEPFTIEEAEARRKELKFSWGTTKKKIKIYKLVEMTEKEVKELMKKKAK